jgi:hypothetical protein
MAALLSSIFPASLKEGVYAALLLAAIGGFTWYTVHERNIGALAVQRQDQRAADAQAAHNTKVETNAQNANVATVAAFTTVISAPPAADAPHLILCDPPTPRGDAVPADAHSLLAAEAAKLPTAIPQARDIGPADDKLHQDADAEIAALQAVLRTCIAQGICKAQAQ